MARRISEPAGCKVSETKPKVKVKSEKPKKLSKAGLWLEAHPNGIGKILDMRAVMR